MKTVFQHIIDREVPARIEFEDEHCVVVHDIHPQAPVHLLVIPRKAIPRIAEAAAGDQALLGHLLLTAAAVAKKLNVAGGYRLVVNSGRLGGESVPHLHVHLLAGRQMTWPPG